MSITCQLCQKSFEKIISSTHLRHAHNISSQEYKNQFGLDSLASHEYRKARSEQSSGQNNSMYGKTHTPESRAAISQKRQGKLAHNKGKKVTDSAVLAKIQAGIAKREKFYQENKCHPRRGAALSQDTRQKISKSIAQYANTHPEEIQQRALKAQATLRERNFDYGSKMRGKTHSLETRQKISLASKIQAQTKRAHARELHQQRAASADITVRGYTGNIMSLHCNKCNNPFEMTIICLTESKFRKDLCPYCRKSASKSRQEIEILDFLRNNYSQTILSGNRNQIWPLELDIFIPSLALAVEYCGLYWHSELQGKGKDYHLQKLISCKVKNIKLITIFEDEWQNKKSIVESRLLSLINGLTCKLSARKCQVQLIPNHLARQFCNENHLQGPGNCSQAYGLYYQEKLVSVMTFSKPNISKGQRAHAADIWELNRFCSMQNCQVQGAAGKLFSAFQRAQQPQEVYTYADMRWSDGNLYKQLGFSWQYNSPPNYWYTINGQLQRFHRFSLRKNQKDNPNLTEWQNRQLQGYNRIWDCGHSKWTWTKKPGI